jgi:hypothetical protein
MSVLRNLVVKILGDTSGLQKSLSSAQTALGGFVGGANKSITKMGLLAAGIGIAVTAAERLASSVVSLAKETMPMYAAQVEGETKLVTVMRQRMGATDDMILSTLALADAEQRTGATEADAVVAGQQQLATFLHSVKALEVLTPAMADLVAQQKGLTATAGDVTSVANMMGKVLDGNVGALKRVGISFTAAQEKMLKSGNEMERASVLAKVIADNVGDMNQALAQTNAGKVQHVANAFDDMKESIGGGFTKVIADLAPQLERLISYLKTAVLWSMALVDVLFGSASGGEENADAQKSQVATGGKLAKTNTALAKSTEKVAKATGGASRAAQKWLASFDQINKIQEASKGGGGGGGGSIGLEGLNLPSFGDGIDSMAQEIDNLKASIQSLMGDPGNGFGMWLAGIKKILTSDDPIGTFLGGLGTLLDPTALFKLIGEGFNWLVVDPVTRGLDNIAWLATEAWKGISDGFNWLVVEPFNRGWDNICKGATDAWNWTMQAFSDAGTFFGGVRNAINAPFLSINSWFASIFGGAWTSTKNAYGGGGGAGSYFTGVLNQIKYAFQGVPSWFGGQFAAAWAGVQNAFAGVGNYFGGLWNTIKSKFTSISSAIGGSVSSAFKTVVNSLFSTIESRINSFINSLNNVISLINKIPGVHVGNIGRISIPRLERGGVVDSATTFMAGEHGKEVVMPLERNTGWMNEFASILAPMMRPAMAGGPGGDTYLMLDGDKINTWAGKKQNYRTFRSNGRG